MPRHRLGSRLVAAALLSGLAVATAGHAAAQITPETPSPPPSGLLRLWDPTTSPFIPIPEIATDPNGGTTVGLLPVMLFTDARQQIRQILAPDLTHNSSLGVGGTLMSC